MSHCVTDYYSIYNESNPKARKEHACAACEETIQKGTYYYRIFMVLNNDIDTVKRCYRCQKIHKYLRTKDYEMWPDERLSCGIKYEDEWGEMDESAKELAFLPTHNEKEMK